MSRVRLAIACACTLILLLAAQTSAFGLGTTETNVLLQVLSVYAPAKPATGSDMVIVGSRGYLAAGDAGLHILDLTKPANPTLLGTFTPGYVSKVSVEGTLALVSAGSSLIAVDVANPAAPAELSRVSLGSYVGSVTVVENRAYVAAAYDGFYIVDIENLAQISLVRRVSLPSQGAIASDIESYGNLLYVSASTAIVIYTVNDLDHPMLSLTHITPAVSATRVGATLYVSGGINGLTIWDLSTPLAPEQLGGYNTPGGAVYSDVRDGKAVVASLSRGVHLLDVSDPAAPILLATYAPTTGIIANKAVFASSRLYVSDALLGIHTLSFGAAVQFTNYVYIPFSAAASPAE